MSKNANILKSQSSYAASYIRGAVTALMNINHDLYPHVRDAVNALDTVVENLNALSTVEPATVPVTALILDCNREQDDPLVFHFDIPAGSDGADVRAHIQGHYFNDFSPIDRPDEFTPYTLWEHNGAYIQAVIPGHVQVGWTASGVDDHTLQAVLTGFTDGM